MAFPTGWGRKQKITISSSQVGGTGSHTNFPVLITLDHLNSEIVDAGSNSALNGGGDIRFSSDSAGSTQLACQIVEFTTNATAGNRRCTVWVKVPSVSGSSNTDIYIWYKKTGEAQPAVTDTYGRNAVWSLYEAVLHLNESSGPFVDSTGNGYDATITDGSPVVVSTAHPIANQTWLDLEFGTNDYLTMAGSTAMLDGSANFMISAWHNNENAGVFPLVSNRVSSPDQNWIWLQSNPGVRAKDTGSEDFANNASPITGTTTFSVGQHTGSNLYLYVNGSLSDTDSTVDVTAGITSNGNYRIGSYYDDIITHDGRIGLIRAAKQEFSADWYLTEFNTIDDPASFATAGTPESVGSSVTISPGSGSITLTGLEPTVEALAPIEVNPNVANIALVGYAPDIAAVNPVNVTPSISNIDITGFSPTVVAIDPKEAIPETISLNLTGYAPDVLAINPIAETPGTSNVSLIGYAPTITADGSVSATPGLCELVITGLSPSVTANGSVQVEPQTGILSLTGYAANVVAINPVRETPETAEISLIAFTPNVKAVNPIELIPETANINFVGLIPAVNISQFVDVTPNAADIVLTAFAPTVITFAFIPNARRTYTLAAKSRVHIVGSRSRTHKL